MRRPQKITLGEMREGGTRGLIVFCADHRCSHNLTLGSATVDQWAGDVRLSDLEPRFVCGACGKRGAEVRPDFNWSRPPSPAMGYRNMK